MGRERVGIQLIWAPKSGLSICHSFLIRKDHEARLTTALALLYHLHSTFLPGNNISTSQGTTPRSSLLPPVSPGFPTHYTYLATFTEIRCCRDSYPLIPAPAI